MVGTNSVKLLESTTAFPCDGRQRSECVLLKPWFKKRLKFNQKVCIVVLHGNADLSNFLSGTQNFLGKYAAKFTAILQK